MAPVNRAAWHNTSIRSSTNRGTKLAGLYAAVGITNANLYSMLEIVCIITSTFDLHDSTEQLVPRDNQQLQAGDYYIVTNGRFLL